MSEYKKAVYDEFAETYDEGLSELLGVLGSDTEKFAEYKIQLLQCLCPPQNKGNVLDFGCGTGRGLSYLEKYFTKYDVQLFGCDVSRESLKVAKKVVPAAELFLNTPVEEFKAFDKTYDLVVLACVLHHIDPGERKLWIKEIVEKLNPGGKIAVFEHNLINPFTRKIVKNPKNTADDINWMLKMTDIQNLLLCDDSIKLFWKGYTLFSPFRFSHTTSIERCLKWLPLGAQQCVIVEKL